ncbi:MAG: hypothetical protein RH949_02700 [Coleofasciculus sp. A1-SPW-01]|uniref:hypothetical protein n=1 Tax=Coleofasciculus sp. A1-SPW-01 TaxID=3070819 RepID=UPI0032F1A2F1
MGFLSNLFGLKSKYVDEETDEAEQAAEAQKRRSYFLEPDDAKTFGDINYMRSPTSVKKRFAKKKDNLGEGLQQEVETSAFGQVIRSNKQISATPEPLPTPQNQQVSESQPNSFERRRADSRDSSMDMFRKMARDMKKQ